MLGILSPRRYACMAPPPCIEAGVGLESFGIPRRIKRWSQRALNTEADSGNSGRKESSSLKQIQETAQLQVSLSSNAVHDLYPAFGSWASELLNKLRYTRSQRDQRVALDRVSEQPAPHQFWQCPHSQAKGSQPIVASL